MLRAAGIVALIVLTACSQTSTAAVASPSPVIPAGNWTQQLTLAGDLAGQMTAIVPDVGTQVSECTGAKGGPGQVWADTFYGTIDKSGQVWAVIFFITNYGGPGTYAKAADVSVQVQSPDMTKVWKTSAADPVTFVIDRSQQSGTVIATLTNATTGQQGLTLNGHWNCRG
jgi:hypothetical protein